MAKKAFKLTGVAAMLIVICDRDFDPNLVIDFIKSHGEVIGTIAIAGYTSVEIAILELLTENKIPFQCFSDSPDNVSPIYRFGKALQEVAANNLFDFTLTAGSWCSHTPVGMQGIRLKDF